MKGSVPETVEDCAVWVESDHPVFDCDTMDEGLLIVQEVGVRHPQLIGHSVIQGQVVGDLRVGQPFVPPRLLEVHGQGVVLQKDDTRGSISNNIMSFWFFLESSRSR